MAAWSGDSSSARGSDAATTAARATAAPKNRELRRREALPELGSWFWEDAGDVESPKRTAKCVQSGGAGRQDAAFVVTEDPIPLEEDGRQMRPCQFQSSRRPLGQPIDDASPPNCPEREFARRFFYNKN